MFTSYDLDDAEGLKCNQALGVLSKLKEGDKLTWSGQKPEIVLCAATSLVTKATRTLFSQDGRVDTCNRIAELIRLVTTRHSACVKEYIRIQIHLSSRDIGKEEEIELQSKQKSVLNKLRHQVDLLLNCCDGLVNLQETYKVGIGTIEHLKVIMVQIGHHVCEMGIQLRDLLTKEHKDKLKRIGAKLGYHPWFD